MTAATQPHTSPAVVFLHAGDLVTVISVYRRTRPEVGTGWQSRVERVDADVEIPADGTPFPAEALQTSPTIGQVEPSRTIVVDTLFEQVRLLVPPAFPLGPVRHARDIPDEAFLDAVRRAAKGSCATRWDIGSALAGLPVPTDFSTEPPIPEKVVLAKARRLIKRGLIDGRCCGCRGDFRINE